MPLTISAEFSQEPSGLWVARHTLTRTEFLASEATVVARNMAHNGSFQLATPLDGWSLYSNPVPGGNVLDTLVASAVSGDRVARVTVGAPFSSTNVGVVRSKKYPVTAAKTYTWSAHGKPSGSPGPSFQVHVHWYDAANAIIGAGNASGTVATTNSSWTRQSVTAAAPAGAVAAAPYAWFVSPGSGAYPGAPLYFDGMQFQEGGLTAYFDASINPNAKWAGVAWESDSILYDRGVATSEAWPLLGIPTRGETYEACRARVRAEWPLLLPSTGAPTGQIRWREEILK